MFEKFNLDMNVAEFVGHALALYLNDESVGGEGGKEGGNVFN